MTSLEVKREQEGEVGGWSSMRKDSQTVSQNL